MPSSSPGTSRPSSLITGVICRRDNTDIVTFRENDGAFRLFGTNVHVKVTLLPPAAFTPSSLFSSAPIWPVPSASA